MYEALLTVLTMLTDILAIIFGKLSLKVGENGDLKQ